MNKILSPKKSISTLSILTLGIIGSLYLTSPVNSAQCGGVETAVINCEDEGAGKSVGNSLGTGVGNGVAEGVPVTSEPASNSITSTAPFNLTVGVWNTYNKNPNNLGTIAKEHQ